MTITAKFAGTCNRCQKPIDVGDQVEWSRGIGTTHLTCIAAPVPEPIGDLKTVIDHIHAKQGKGESNEFLDSLAKQYRVKGTLSAKQIAAVMRKIPGSSQAVPILPRGRYAVETEQGWLLLNVWHPRTDETVQRIYHVQGHDDSGHALRGKEERAAALAIHADPAKAARDFGHRTGHCYRCGHELDVNLSRSMGVGPVCVKHVLGDEDRKALLAEHRDKLRAAGLDPNESNDDLSKVAA